MFGITEERKKNYFPVTVFKEPYSNLIKVQFHSFYVININIFFVGIKKKIVSFTLFENQSYATAMYY